MIIDKEKKQLKESYKIIFVGECFIGAKSSLINYILYGNISDEFPISKNYIKTISLGNGETINLYLVDTAGQHNFRPLLPKMMENSDCIILGFDLTNKYTFEEIKKFWYEEAKKITNLLYLIGNKSDLYDEFLINEKEIIDYAIDNNLRYFKTSCINGSGINEFINTLANDLYRRA